MPAPSARSPSTPAVDRDLVQPALRFVVAAALIGAPAWGGTTRPPATLVLAALCAVAGAAATWLRWRDPDRPCPLPPLAAPLLVLAAACALQLVPLPPSLRSVLSPNEAHVSAAVLKGLEAGAPGPWPWPWPWRPLSADVAATLHQCARLLGLAALTLGLARVHGESGRRSVRRALAASLLVVLLLALAATLHLPVPSWIVSAPTTRALALFPFVNPNHAAAFIAMLLPLLIAMAARPDSPTLGPVALVLAGNLALLATLSRAGIALGVGAQALMLWLVLFRPAQRRDRRTRRRMQRLVLAAGVALTVAAVPIAGRLAERLGAGAADRSGSAGLPSSPGLAVPVGDPFSHGRLQAARDALSLLGDHALAGVGRGAFGYVFTRYNRAGAQLRYDFVENEYLQLPVDVGVPAAMAVLGALLWAARRAARAFEAASERAQAAAIGIGVAALHSAVDFSVESGGVAVVVCALAALAFPTVRREAEGAPKARAWTTAWGLVPLATVALLVVAASPMGRTADEDVLALRSAEQDPARTAAELDDLTVAAFRRHPSDALIAEVAARRLLAADDARCFDWLERALLLAPRDVVAHRLTAWALSASHLDDQAAGELYTALVDAGSADLAPLCADAVRLFGSDAHAEQLVAALPPGPNLSRCVLDELAARHAWRLVERVGRGMLERDPDDIDVLRRLVTAGLEAGSFSLPSTAGVLAARARHLAELDRSAPTTDLAARALTAAGDRDGGMAVLDAALRRGPATDLALTLSRLCLEGGDTSRAAAALDEALARAVDVHDKRRLHLALAEVQERRGNATRALWERSEAARLADY